MPTTYAEPAALTVEDRCDRCGAQAYVRVILGDSELLFCGHHFARHSAQLRPMADRVDDFTDRLAATQG